MKLVQRKCPSCGATLPVDENAKEVTCEYCKQTLAIEREEEKDNCDSNTLLTKYYEEKNNSHSKKVIKVVVMFFSICFLIGLISVFPILLEEENNFSQKKDEKEENLQEQYVTDFSEIDAKSLELFHKETKKNLDTNRSFLPRDSKETEWESVGLYLLVSKDMSKYHERMNILFDVYKKTYTVNNKKIDAYAGLKYKDLKLSNDKIVIHSFSGSGLYIMNFIGDSRTYFMDGYESLEEFYTKEIRQYIGDYNIKATDGLYIEKLGE